MGYFIGMDVGGTYARLKIVDRAGRTLHESEGKGGTISSAGLDKMKERVDRLLSPALHASALSPRDCLGLCLGASGIDSPELRLSYERILEGLGFEPRILRAYNDCELLLSLFSGPCVVLISGTGSIAMGRTGPEAPICRCGGWSYILSDEGSAPSISFSAMRAVLKHWDGQLYCPALAELFVRSTGLATPQALTAWCHQNLQRKDLLARFAPMVEQAAQAGDPCAEGLLTDAARQLFALVATTARKTAAPQGRFSVLLWGSVLTENARVRGALCRQIEQAYPNADVFMLRSNALDCAVQLAMGRPAQGLMQSLLGEEAG